MKRWPPAVSIFFLYSSFPDIFSVPLIFFILVDARCLNIATYIITLMFYISNSFLNIVTTFIAEYIRLLTTIKYFFVCLISLFQFENSNLKTLLSIFEKKIFVYKSFSLFVNRFVNNTIYVKRITYNIHNIFIFIKIDSFQTIIK